MPEAGSPPRLRPFWSGVITFGLVSVPVDLFPAYRSARTSLRMVAPDGTPLERRYFCPAHDREVGRDEIVRGYEVEDGRFVVVGDDELESVEPKKSKEIDLQRFVDRGELEPVFFDRAYLLTPGGEANKPYRLLAETMERTGRAGIARFVMRGHEYLVAILADDGVLRAETMRFHDEIRSAADIGVPRADGGEEAKGRETVDPPGSLVAEIRSRIEELAADELEPDELEDRSEDRLRELVDRKLEAGEDVAEPPAGGKEEEGAATEGVIDLMEVLKRRLHGSEGTAEDESGGAPGGRADGAPDDGTSDDGTSEEGGSRAGRGRRTTARRELRKLTKDELYQQARDREVPGRSGMNKDELVEALSGGGSSRKSRRS